MEQNWIIRSVNNGSVRERRNTGSPLRWFYSLPHWYQSERARWFGTSTTKPHTRAWDLLSDQLLTEPTWDRSAKDNRSEKQCSLWENLLKHDPDCTVRLSLFRPVLQMLSWLYETLPSNYQSKQGNLSKCLISCIFFFPSKVRKAAPYVPLNSWQKSARKIQCKYVSVLMKHKAFRLCLYNPSKYMLHKQTHVPEEWLDERGWHRVSERNWSANLIN